MVPSCSRCKTSRIIADDTYGHSVCTSCGMVVENTIISDEQEWRNFKDDNSGSLRNRISLISYQDVNDPSKFSCSSYSTRLDHSLKVDPGRRSNALKKTVGQQRQLLKVSADVAKLAEQLLEQYSATETSNFKNFRSLSAAALLLAAKQTGFSLNSKDTADALGLQTKALNKAQMKLARVCKDAQETGAVNSVWLSARRIAAKLEISPTSLKEGEEVGLAIEKNKLFEGRRLSSKSALCFLVANGCLEEPREFDWDLFLRAAGVGKTTVDTVLNLAIKNFRVIFKTQKEASKVVNYLLTILNECSEL